MYIAYNPVVIYLVTLFICLGLLIKALKDMCKTVEDEDEENQRDHQESRKEFKGLEHADLNIFF